MWVLAAQTQTLQRERGEVRASSGPETPPERGCSGGCAVLGASTVLGHLPKCQDISEPPWGRALRWSSPRKGGREEAQPDAPLPIAPRRGVGCIHYEMATGRPLFPGSTVKEELHLIFRLLGQSPALPQHDHQGALELCPARAHKGTGKSGCACSAGRSPLWPWPFSAFSPTLHRSTSPLVLAPYHAFPIPFCLHRDPYRRDVARSDGPV